MEHGTKPMGLLEGEVGLDKHTKFQKQDLTEEVFSPIQKPEYCKTNLFAEITITYNLCFGFYSNFS